MPKRETHPAHVGSAMATCWRSNWHWPTNLPFRRPERRPVRGGRWYVRKVPKGWAIPLHAPEGKTWKAYNLSQPNRNRWFETHEEAFAYAQSEVIRHAKRMKRKGRDYL